MDATAWGSAPVAGLDETGVLGLRGVLWPRLCDVSWSSVLDDTLWRMSAVSDVTLSSALCMHATLLLCAAVAPVRIEKIANIQDYLLGLT